MFYSTLQKTLIGHKHNKPPKSFCHKYNLYAITFFGNVWTSHIGLFLLVVNIFD